MVYLEHFITPSVLSRRLKTKTPIPLGPERMTILERVIGLTRLPYSLGCLVFAVVATKIRCSANSIANGS
jgi:hypothetical protein